MPARLSGPVRAIVRRSTPTDPGRTTEAHTDAKPLPPCSCRCAPRQKPLVVVAGEGKTGTESLSTALAMLGLKVCARRVPPPSRLPLSAPPRRPPPHLQVAHFESLIQCCHVVYANASVPDVTVLGIDTGLPGRGSNPICQTTARHSGHTCRDVSWDFQYQPYIDLVGRIKTLPSLEYDDFDWCARGPRRSRARDERVDRAPPPSPRAAAAVAAVAAVARQRREPQWGATPHLVRPLSADHGLAARRCVFDDYDVVADVPIPFIAPYLYQAYGPGTKVINTVRAAGDWAARRAGWDAHLDLGDLAPLGWIFADSIAKGAMAGKPTNAVALYNRSKSAATYAYIAERALIHCTVQPVDLMELDLLVRPPPESPHTYTRTRPCNPHQSPSTPSQQSPCVRRTHPRITFDVASSLAHRRASPTLRRCGPRSPPSSASAPRASTRASSPTRRAAPPTPPRRSPPLSLRRRLCCWTLLLPSPTPCCDRPSLPPRAPPRRSPACATRPTCAPPTSSPTPTPRTTRTARRCRTPRASTRSSTTTRRRCSSFATCRAATRTSAATTSPRPIWTSMRTGAASSRGRGSSCWGPGAAETARGRTRARARGARAPAVATRRAPPRAAATWRGWWVRSKTPWATAGC
eukprot:4696733-Prymnesium_polylepis.1